MNVTLKTWSRRLAWALPMIALLAGCDAGKETAKDETSKPHAVATYVNAPWEALPAVSDSDLLAGFESWRSACQRLKADPVWGATCAAAATVPSNAVAVRGFLKERLDVFGLRSADNTPNGLITGYYEPCIPAVWIACVCRHECWHPAWGSVHDGAIPVRVRFGSDCTAAILCAHH